MNKEHVKLIQLGNHAIENDGSLEELEAVFKACWPNDMGGSRSYHEHKYFFNEEGTNKRWDYSHATTLPTIKVTDFFLREFTDLPNTDESKLVSDGGSNCPYYMITLPKEVITTNKDGSVTFQVKDIGYYFLDNDFDKINIFKAIGREGKKEGINEEYDLKKVVHTAKERLERFYIKNPGKRKH